MCGIAGLVALAGAPPPEVAQIERMCRSIVHRGPDDEGVWVHGNVGLGMRRLAIIDLAGGQQPVFNEDGTVATVFNGEIYNFRELRQRLIKAGHQFRTDCDTEVIVHAYEQYGDDFANHLNGMFAIALYDLAQQRLLLVRDHLGIKPLFYSLTDSHLVFGSEIKVLLESGQVPRQLHLDALGQFMAWEYVPGTDTLLQGVHKLQPGAMLSLSLDGARVSRRAYWEIQAGERALDARAWEDAVDEQLARSVRMQMVADVPLGAFLSGGVDSSLIVAAMGGDARTFSIGFEDPSYNELAYSQQVAEHLGVSHTTEVVKPQVVQHFDHLMHFMDDPIGDFSIFPTFLVSRLARQHVSVALSGDGGDELFGGYDTYVAQQLARTYERLPAWFRTRTMPALVGLLPPQSQKKGLINKVQRFAQGAALPPALMHARWRLFADASWRALLFTKDAQNQMQQSVDEHILKLADEAGAMDDVNRMLFVDTRSYLSENILTKLDRMSMAVSLETRVPFLDKDLVQLAFQIPESMKLAQRQTKVLLKRVAARHIPHECVYRQKEGFSIPIKTWLGTQFRPVMEALLSEQRIKAAGLFNWQTVERLKVEHLQGKANHSHLLWSMIVFEAWRDKWLEGSNT